MFNTFIMYIVWIVVQDVYAVCMFYTILSYQVYTMAKSRSHWIHKWLLIHNGYSNCIYFQFYVWNLF